MANLLAILGLSLFCFAFWQQRRQSELAKQAIARRCKQLDIQLLSTAFEAHRFKNSKGRFGWHTVYEFEFSSLGDDYYIGELTMVGFRPVSFEIPPYRM